MSKSDKWSARVCIEDNGKRIPCLLIDSEGKVTRLISEEEQERYEQKMLKNIGETMSRFYTAHPEYLEKECQNEQRQQSA